MKKNKINPEEMTVYETLQIFPNARNYKTNLTKKYRNRKQWKRPDPQEILSVIPGVVTSFSVELGSHVNKGDEIMIYEAMKMQNIIRAPFDGTVEQIFVKTGEKVAKGVVMMYLKSDVEFVYEDINDDLSAIVPDPVV
ncbi:MAG: acetyl-CoA carboxylase biotin carboxyl carrier protein subunit [Bacteroidales bacterium]|jgi:biotin carboxyl carrier protein|nr:acetyl-CoA carboxylase biotin carboxyl carrier protein subunit [Bacteroidales bacterium]MBP9583896.1 acetyl-CoA carboxylase biotin carboxyl carrier protein subunit [Bacteroidales bacterium]MBP9978593.1 acetyl-CoA carboxylase biotin carboxyl carrier protein subunit [Bacteroidales bacterium]WRQ32144.1 biotin/lipoyl-containing protein [Bacteroidales bacterium MB20-C3-3]